jgi:hypothetical protein
MKWYKLLTRFFIWAFALLYLAIGINGITYAVKRLVNFNPWDYGLSRGYYMIILIACTLSICVTILFVISGIALIRFKKCAPSLLIGTLAFWTASSAVSTIMFAIYLATWSSRKIHLELILPGLAILILSTAPSAVALILNIIYFKKRKNLFIK